MPRKANLPKDPTLRTVAQNIRRLRETQGLSQVALAAKVPMGRARLNQIEQAKEDPRLSAVARIARGLQVSVARLLKEAPSA